MQFRLINRGFKRLLMFFSGWGSSEEMLTAIDVPDYDILLIWDYLNVDFPLPEIENYQEIAVVTWSFGTPTAAQFILSHPGLPITCKAVINGTLYPCDDVRGIPEAIFQGTHDRLDERNFAKFLRRMGYKAPLETVPDIEHLRAELKAIGERKPEVTLFDTAYVGRNDRIIPSENQHRCWQQHAARVVETDDLHFPDFASLLRRIVINKRLVESRFARAAKSYDQAAQVQQRVVRHLIDLWKPAQETGKVIEVGCGTGLSTRVLLQATQPEQLTLMDLCINDSLPQEAEKIKCDAEIEIRNVAPESVDVIFSSSAMQWFNSAPAFLKNCARALRRGGKAVIATYGNATYADLRLIAGIEKRYPDAENLLMMIPRDMHLDLMATERIKVEFSSGRELMRHVKATGVNALSSHENALVAARNILKAYPGKCALIYQPIYLILTKL